MTHLLLWALKISALIASTVRPALTQTAQGLSGLYPRQPKKQTTAPRASTLLRYFCKQKLSLSRFSRHSLHSWQVPALNETCKLLLSCLGFDEQIYQQLHLFLNDGGGLENGNLKCEKRL